MPSLRAVLFDIDDTLVATSEFARLARRNAVDAMIEAGLEMEFEAVLAELNEVIGEFSSNYDHHFDKLIQRLELDLGGKNRALIVAAGVVAYHNTKFTELEPFDDVIPLLKGLQKAGLKTGVITHGWTVKQAEKLVRLKLVPYLEPSAIFISDQIGISKPNPKLYQTALRSLGLAAEEVMYVGDSPAHDIVPANTIGMVSVYSSRASRYRIEQTGVEPTYSVANFEELREILNRDFGLTL
ncbi:MAG: putative hydrolase of the HAD superfamily [Planctomycetota bacterium]|jgi:putative hydrolase of the HAD superfamily